MIINEPESGCETVKLDTEVEELNEKVLKLKVKNTKAAPNNSMHSMLKRPVPPKGDDE
jgi:hypothetical protein